MEISHAQVVLYHTFAHIFHLSAKRIRERGDLEQVLMCTLIYCCGGTGTDSTIPTNTNIVEVPITTGTVTDSGSVYRYWFIRGDKWIYLQDR